MKKQTIIKITKIENLSSISDRARENTKENYKKSLDQFEKLSKKLIGKTITITRKNQALAKYEYAGANWKRNPPSFYVAQLKIDENNNATLVFTSCYKNVDDWKIID